MNELLNFKLFLSSGEKIFSDVKKAAELNIVFQNLGIKLLEKVVIELVGPIEIKILTLRRSINMIQPKQTKRLIFKVKPNQIGSFSLTTIIHIKNKEIARAPIKIHVEQPNLSQQSNPIQIPTQTNAILKVKDQSEAIFCNKNVKKEFYLGVQNSSPDLMERLKISITSPDQIRIGTGIRGLGNIAVNKEKFSSFSIIPKENGKFTINATLFSGNTTIATLPIEIRVGLEFYLEIFHFKGNGLYSNIDKDSIAEDNTTEPNEENIQIKALTTCPLCYEEIEPDSGYCKSCKTVLN